MYADKTLTCAGCGTSFTFSAEDQEYHAQRGFMNEPKRCPACRAARRAERGSQPYAGSNERELFVTTCSQCGKEARVPFQPRDDRPVYCSDCYRPSRPGAASGSDRSGYGYERRGGRWYQRPPDATAMTLENS